ncbi:MFS transporter [bacterium]|nr:MFS transporter [bacterium]MBU1072670.1 MFS transporter [bacterium]MBU1675648.1 MFS transporter [bacterium]
MSDTTARSEGQGAKSIGQVVSDAFKELGTTLVAFVRAPRALWGINIPYIIEGLCYFGGLTILGKFCSENVGLNDVVSGYVYSAVTGGITLAMLIFGGFADKIGVRASLALSLGMMSIGRALVALSDTLGLENGLWSPMFMTMAGGLLIMVLNYGLYQPAAYAGVKRYTNPQTAAMGYAVVYALMNLGGFIFGGLSPAVRSTVGGHFPPNGLAAVYWVLAGLTLSGSLITLLVITRRTDRAAVARVKLETRGIRTAGDTGADAEGGAKPAPASYNKMPFVSLLLLSLTGLVMFVVSFSGRFGPMDPAIGRAPTWFSFGILGLTALLGAGATWEFLRHNPDHPFRNKRFVFFIFILIPVQTLFAHQWLTLPYYCDRAFTGSPVSEYFEFFSNLNPLLIFILAPLVAGLTARANIYKMMIIGTTVMAAPTFLLTLGPRLYPLIGYIVLMSIGEAMWQPRFLQWIAEIAPEGKTGAYMGIGQLPWFLTKVVTGLYSGHFVANYCPLPGTGLPQRTEIMWLFYGIIAMVSPVVLVLARKWMQKGMQSKSI